jgi:hypothetical protein
VSHKTFNVKSKSFPLEAAAVIVDMLRGKVPFNDNKWKAIYAALELITFLSSYVAGEYTTKASRAPKLSKKVIADTIEKIAASKKTGISASSFDVPVWLLPILAKLLLKWIECNYITKGSSDEKKG